MLVFEGPWVTRGLTPFPPNPTTSLAAHGSKGGPRVFSQAHLGWIVLDLEPFVGFHMLFGSMFLWENGCAFPVWDRARVGLPVGFLCIRWFKNAHVLEPPSVFGGLVVG